MNWITRGTILGICWALGVFTMLQTDTYQAGLNLKKQLAECDEQYYDGACVISISKPTG